MKGNDAVKALVASLEPLGIDDMITGSYASNVHGVPRSTQDADFVIEAPGEEGSRLLATLARALETQPFEGALWIVGEGRVRVFELLV